MKKLLIEYQHYIPETIINEFEKSGIGNEFAVEYVKKEKPRYSNFTGEEIRDIVIFVQQHETELIVKGLLIKATYDLLKAGIKGLWSELKKINDKKAEPSRSNRCMSIHLQDKERTIEIKLDGDFDDKVADTMLDKAIEFIQSNEVEKSFTNPDFIPNGRPQPTINLIYNKEKGTWEPENFGQYRRRMKDIERKAERNFAN